MISRWKVADFEYIPAFEEDPKGDWVKWEDVQEACMESYDAGRRDTLEAVQEALGLND